MSDTDVATLRAEFPDWGILLIEGYWYAMRGSANVEAKTSTEMRAKLRDRP